jgi:hypothetical protein
MFPPCDSRLVWFQHFHVIGSLAERTNDDIAVFRLNKDLAKDVNRDVPDEERVVVIGAGGMETRYCSAFWAHHAKGPPEKWWRRSAVLKAFCTRSRSHLVTDGQLMGLPAFHLNYQTIVRLIC